MKKNIIFALVVLSIFILIFRFGYQPLMDFLGYKARAGIKITSIPDGAIVYIEGTEVGKTPYENDNLDPKEYDLRLVSDNAFWQGSARLTKGTLTVVNREIAVNIASSSGEILTLNTGQGVVITSNPTETSVEIDGKDYGKTPLKVADLSSGEHTFLLSHSNYLKRSIRALLPEKMTLHLDVNLAISEIDLSSTSSAPTITSLVKLVVLQTPTGFLRVRERPTTTATELVRLSTGDTVTLLEELNGWNKIKLDNGMEGYVSANYVQKQP